MIPKKILCVAVCLSAWVNSATAQRVTDSTQIGIYVTPYYNSEGPQIDVGHFSEGLASDVDTEFEATIRTMQKSWDKLTFMEMYVASIRLYELGYRKESVYWFYSAQYRGRLFAMLVDKEKQGEIGDEGFELSHAQNAFYQLVRPFVNGYALGDPDHLRDVVQRVLKENEKLPDIKAIYKGVSFKDESEWKAEHKMLNDGMAKLLTFLKDEKDQIKQQRIENGNDARFGKLKSRDLTKPAEAAPKSDKPESPNK